MTITKRAGVLCIVLVAIASVRIGLTWTVFNHTCDEVGHVAIGMEWLEAGTYLLETEHPPLARVVAGLGARAAGGHYRADFEAPVNNWSYRYWRGRDILFLGDHYLRTVALMRSAMLPFFWLACLAVYLWGRLLYGDLGACLSVFLFAMMPFVLAHAGLATTDMAATATFAIAAYALVRLMQSPGPRTAVFFGISAGLMLLAKFSTIPYFGAGCILALAVWVWRRRGLRAVAWLPRLAWLGFSSLAAFVMIWAMYRFSFGPSTLLPFPVPFPEWFSGINTVLAHNRRGHTAYFLGTYSAHGSMLFFPVLFLVKTPLAILALFFLSPFIRPRGNGGNNWLAWIAVAAVLAIAIPARINIGLRHILPLFPFVAVLAAGAGVALWERAQTMRGPRLAVTGLLLCTAGASLWAHPDYLADFNLLAGPSPGKIVADSDLDWGQDTLRLAKRLQELHAPSVAFSTDDFTYRDRLGFPPTTNLSPLSPAPGWNAVSLRWLRIYRLGLMDSGSQLTLWPDRFPPREMVGKTILLYYFTSDLEPGEPPPAARR